MGEPATGETSTGPENNPFPHPANEERATRIAAQTNKKEGNHKKGTPLRRSDLATDTIGVDRKCPVPMGPRWNFDAQSAAAEAPMVAETEV